MRRRDFLSGALAGGALVAASSVGVANSRPPAARRRLAGPTRYAVAPHGDDARADGTEGRPFRTVSACWHFLRNYVDCAGFPPLIRLAPGRYPGARLEGNLTGVHVARLLGAGPGKSVLQGGRGEPGLILRDLAWLQVGDVTVETDGSAHVPGLAVQQYCVLDPLTGLELGAADGAQLDLSQNARVNVLADIVVAGSNGDALVSISDQSNLSMAGHKFVLRGNHRYRRAVVRMRGASVLNGSPAMFDAAGATVVGRRYDFDATCALYLAGAKPDVAIPGSLPGRVVSAMQ